MFVAVLVSLLSVEVPCAQANIGDMRWERPSSGYEGSYEWRGVYGYTVAYNWLFPVNGSEPGKHVTSFYIHHPTNYKHMEVGLVQFESLGDPYVFTQYNENPDRVVATPVMWGQVDLGSTHKFVIRNLTMGNPDGVDEHWIMSFDDQELPWSPSQLHSLTYGRAFTASEIYNYQHYVGDDNRAHFWNLKRTSKPAAWTSWTDNRLLVNQDENYDFGSMGDNYWYNNTWDPIDP